MLRMQRQIKNGLDSWRQLEFFFVLDLSLFFFSFLTLFPSRLDLDLRKKKRWGKGTFQAESNVVTVSTLTKPPSSPRFLHFRLLTRSNVHAPLQVDFARAKGDWGKGKPNQGGNSVNRGHRPPAWVAWVAQATQMRSPGTIRARVLG